MRIGIWLESQDQGLSEAIRLFAKRHNRPWIKIKKDQHGYCTLEGATEIEESVIWGMNEMQVILNDQGPFDDEDQIQIKRLIYGNLEAADTKLLGPYEDRR